MAESERLMECKTHQCCMDQHWSCHRCEAEALATARREAFEACLAITEQYQWAHQIARAIRKLREEAGDG